MTTSERKTTKHVKEINKICDNIIKSAYLFYYRSDVERKEKMGGGSKKIKLLDSVSVGAAYDEH